MPVQSRATEHHEPDSATQSVPSSSHDRYREVLDLLDSRSDNDIEHVKLALRLLVQLLMEGK